jgi:5-formyltetrahydrofolate cyclo-ligase
VPKTILRKKILVYRKNNYKIVSLKYFLLKDILKKFNLLKNKKIGAYFPINYEIDCLEILKQLEKSGHKISLPIIRKKNKMDFFEWSSKEPLLIGKIGIPEPYPKKKVYPDILLVPLVAFNKYKFRLGYGGGYYDRYIQKIKKIKKILTIGMAFSFQEIKKLPINEHDKKLDFIFTENYIK